MAEVEEAPVVIGRLKLFLNDGRFDNAGAKLFPLTSPPPTANDLLKRMHRWSHNDASNPAIYLRDGILVDDLSMVSSPTMTMDDEVNLFRIADCRRRLCSFEITTR